MGVSYQAIGLSVALGLLVGLQREWKSSEIAGIRTFPLLTLFGTLSATLTDAQLGLVIAAGLASTAALLLIANVAKFKAHVSDPGMTTEVAAMLMYLVGVSVGLGWVGPPVVISGVVAILLQWKRPLHGMVGRLSEKEIRGIFHLVLIALVILPVLPDRTYGPYDVLNPYQVWLMVVLIVGISMAAYVAYQLLGTRAGAILGGILGGLISSTATTVSYARQTKDQRQATSVAALVIVIASAVVNLRVLGEIAVVAPELLRWALLPISLILAVMVAEAVLLYLPLRRRAIVAPEHENPAQLKPAIIFGLLYAVILLVVAAAKHHLGEEALYGVAMISGLTDVDAITLSTARLFLDDRVSSTTAWRVIMIATMSNLAFKTGAVAALGNRRLFAVVAGLFGVTFVAGSLVLIYWPTDLVVPTDWMPAYNGRFQTSTP